ncbi:50S ribosomal protein L19 [Candidatus Peregrinibacteria bacterium CG1_02_54_53]|nr:MAG: 50S ribosomal protein L19 [Candidatus Peregrinibacteria bacterium CG1_02_54_53]
MVHQILREQAERFIPRYPAIKPGYTVRVHEQIQEEGGKPRIQIFEGLVISTHNGHVPTDRTITVRRIASGVGVEKNFPLSSTVIKKIEVKKVASVRRAKLNFLRGRTGKSARLSERFTTADEFSIAAAPEPISETQEAPIDEQQTENAETVKPGTEEKAGKKEEKA